MQKQPEQGVNDQNEGRRGCRARKDIILCTHEAEEDSNNTWMEQAARIRDIEGWGTAEGELIGVCSVGVYWSCREVCLNADER